jgi:3-methyladenine DNA glycosylase AlkD
MVRQGAGENLFGTPLGPLRQLAKEIKRDHELGLELWATGNVDAQLLAVMILDPAALDEAQVVAMASSVTYVLLLDDLTYRLIAQTAAADQLRDAWRDATNDLLRRAGWALEVAYLGEKKTPADELEATLTRIEAELPTATEHAQWTMNHALVQIALTYPQYTDRCLELGERLGVYKDLKVAKGCTSAYAPAWINVMLAKRG